MWGRCTGLIGPWLEAQYVLCGAPQPRHPPARGGGRAAGHHAVSGQRRHATAAGVVPCLPQLRAATHELAPTVAGSCSDQWHGLGQGVAAVYTRDGRGIDRARVELERGADVSGATM